MLRRLYSIHKENDERWTIIGNYIRLPSPWLGHADARQVSDLPNSVRIGGRRPQKQVGDLQRRIGRSPASQRLAAHRHGQAIWKGVRYGVLEPPETCEHQAKPYLDSWGVPVMSVEGSRRLHYSPSVLESVPQSSF